MKFIYYTKEFRAMLDDYLENYDPKAYRVESKLTCFRFQERLARVAKNLPKDARVLDIGCGIGHTTAVLKIMRPDLDIIGMDINKGAYWSKFAKRYNIEYLVGDATKLNFKDKSFDAIMYFGVLEHVGDDKKMLKEINRVLKNGGMQFIHSLPTYFSMNEFLAKILKLGPHDKRYFKSEIIKKLKSAGFGSIYLRYVYLIPSQIQILSKRMGPWYNKNYKLINRLDRFLLKTPLYLFSQAFIIYCKKEKDL